MDDIIEWIKDQILLIVVVLLCVVAIGISIYSVYFTNRENKKLVNSLNKQSQTTEVIANVTEDDKKTYVDIKGAIQNPGVYECNNCLVKDVIDLAGGLTKDATTKNINLSKQVCNEMVVIINTKNELKKLEQTNSANVINNAAQITDKNSNSNNNQTSGLININSADINTLITLNGIGEAKAQSIIDYRNANGPFKTIEDLLNVDGIGEALFAKIKDYITV